MITRRRTRPDEASHEKEAGASPRTPDPVRAVEEGDPVPDLFNMEASGAQPDPDHGPDSPPEDESTQWLLDQLPDPESGSQNPAGEDPPDEIRPVFDPGPPPSPTHRGPPTPATGSPGPGPGGTTGPETRPRDPEEPSLQYGGEPSGERDVENMHQTPPEPPLSTLRNRRTPRTPGEPTMRIAIAATEFNYDITSMMVERARAHAEVLGAQVHHIVRVPGVFDLPLAVKRLLARDDVDGVAALGCVIEGETDHDDLVIQHAARKIIDLSLDTDKPVGLGITGPGMSRMQAMARIDRAKDAVEATYRMHQELAAL